jgi:homogentisate phytyltransferase / homogentisate geranylgeranyltransferase
MPSPSVCLSASRALFLLAVITSCVYINTTAYTPCGITTTTANRLISARSSLVLRSLSDDAALSASIPLPSPAIPLISTLSSDMRQNMLTTIWKFSRPHTIVGSGLSVLCVFLFASSMATWRTMLFWTSLYKAAVPALFMNLYITGLNQVLLDPSQSLALLLFIALYMQVTDVEIDKVNKPYLPIPAGDLSIAQGSVIVLASLVASLILGASQPWPLQFTLLSSALLGTMYSLPPFRLKRYPLLAALCILVVRGSVVNVGFFLHAKAVLFNQNVPSIMAGLKAFPECIAATVFFAFFGLVIAIMKDVPDVKGDALYSIPTFSVRVGAKRVFRISWLMLVSLLGGASVATAASIPAILSSTTSLTKVLAKIALSTGLGGMAWDVRRRARQVETDSDSEVFSFYMYVWNIFYACYLLLPLLKI